MTRYEARILLLSPVAHSAFIKSMAWSFANAASNATVTLLQRDKWSISLFHVCYLFFFIVSCRLLHSVCLCIRRWSRLNTSPIPGFFCGWVHYKMSTEIFFLLLFVWCMHECACVPECSRVYWCLLSERSEFTGSRMHGLARCQPIFHCVCMRAYDVCVGCC